MRLVEDRLDCLNFWISLVGDGEEHTAMRDTRFVIREDEEVDAAGFEPATPAL